MTVHGLGRVCAACALIALTAFGCKTEPATDSGGVTGAGTGGVGVAGVPAGGATAAGTGGVTGFGAPTGGVGAAGTTGAAGVTGAGTGGIGAAGVGAAGATAAGTGGMTAAGTSGMSGGGTGGMSAAGTGGMPAADEVQSCIDMAAEMGRTGACTECGCMKCLAEIQNCQDEACSSVVSCGQMSGCKGRECYCGTTDLITCAGGFPSGACKAQIEAASGLVAAGECMANQCASVLSEITNPDLDTYDPNNPVSRANQVSICTRGQEMSDGFPGGCSGTECIVGPVPDIPGKCETECMQ